VHSEHTAWYDPITLMALCMRCGLQPEQLIWVREPVGLDLRVLPRLFRRFYNSNFILVLVPQVETDG